MGRVPVGVYGFALAQDLARGEERTGLVAHGTLYKALDRLRRAGYLSAEWEDARTAEDARRPRRRVYHVTAEGRRILAEAGSAAPQRGWGEAPA